MKPSVVRYSHLTLVGSLKAAIYGAAMTGSIVGLWLLAFGAAGGPIIVTAPADPPPAAVAPAHPLPGPLHHWVAFLKLDSKQQDELKQIYTEFRAEVAPVLKDRHTTEVGIRDAVIAGKSEGDLASMHDQLAADERKLSVSQTTAYRKALAILTADQLKHAAALFSLFAVGL
jgi:hypothetical protein